MRRFIIATALTAVVSSGAVISTTSTAQAQSPYNMGLYNYGPYERGYRSNYDWYGRYGRYDWYDRYGDRGLYLYYDPYDSRLGLHDYDRYNRSPYVGNIYDRRYYDYYDRDYDFDYYDRGVNPYRTGYRWTRGYGPYGTGYRGLYLDPDRGLNINTGNFRFRIGW